MYNNIASFITRTAAMVPADKYRWAPTSEVRSYARLFAHIIDDNNGACAAVAGVTPAPARLDTHTVDVGWVPHTMTKADLEEGPGGFRGALPEGVCRRRSGQHDADAGPSDQDRRAHLQHESHQRALRQPGDVPAPERSGAAVEPVARGRTGRARALVEPGAPWVCGGGACAGASAARSRRPELQFVGERLFALHRQCPCERQRIRVQRPKQRARGPMRPAAPGLPVTQGVPAHADHVGELPPVLPEFPADLVDVNAVELDDRAAAGFGE